MVSDIQRTFRNIHQDKMAFLIGTGPSFNSVNIDLLRPYVTMVLNASIVRFNDPTYLFSTDSSIYDYDYLDYINKEETTKVVLEEYNFPHDSEYTEIRGKSLEHFYGFRRRGYYDDQPDPRNTDDTIIMGLSSAHCAAHMLYIMGCNPIVLLGCECKYDDINYAYWVLSGNEKYVTDKHWKEAEKTDESLANYHLHAIWRGQGFDGKSDNYLRGFARYWGKMWEFNPNMGIIDACDSIMQCFPKMTLEEVLEKYGDRVKDG